MCDCPPFVLQQLIMEKYLLLILFSRVVIITYLNGEVAHVVLMEENIQRINFFVKCDQLYEST